LKKLAVTIILILMFCTAAIAETSLWKVTSETSELYIGGTCHVLRKTDYPLPTEFDTAYSNAEIIIFETDIGALTLPETQNMILQKGKYPDGNTLETVLSAETYSVLDTHCETIGLPIASLKAFKPSIVILTFYAIELQKHGVTQSGVDLFYYEKATNDQKKTGQLETIEKQIDYLTGLGSGNEDAFVMQSIKDIQETGDIITGLIQAWREGDEPKLVELILESMEKEYPDLYRLFILERNQQWLPAIEDHLRTPETELILVGVGHLVGKDSIIKMLEDKKYKIEKISSEE